MKKKATVLKMIYQMTFYLGLALVWWLVFQTGLFPEDILPEPTRVFGWIYHSLGDLSFWSGILCSMGRIIVGYTIAFVLGVSVGILMSQNRFLDLTLGPFIVSLQTVPNICWVPLLTLWFGASNLAIIVNVTLGSFLSIVIGTDAGFKHVPSALLNAAKNMGASGWTLSRYVKLPAALPSIVSGMKQGWAFAWRGLISAEMLFAAMGIGNMLMKGRDRKDMVEVLAVMLVIIILGWLVNQIVFSEMERRVRRKWGLDKA